MCLAVKTLSIWFSYSKFSLHFDFVFVVFAHQSRFCRSQRRLTCDSSIETDLDRLFHAFCLSSNRRTDRFSSLLAHFRLPVSLANQRIDALRRLFLAVPLRSRHPRLRLALPHALRQTERLEASLHRHFAQLSLLFPQYRRFVRERTQRSRSAAPNGCRSVNAAVDIDSNGVFEEWK